MYDIQGQSDPGSTNYSLMITNFCYALNDANEFIQYPMTTDFFDDYVRVYSNGDGRAQYCIEVVQESDGAWHVLIYNNLLQKYDDLIDFTGSTQINDGAGWTMFETHFAYNEVSPSVGCPPIPNIGSSGVRVRVQGLWEELGGGAQFQTRGNPAQCFSDDLTTPDYYAGRYPAVEPDGNSSDMDWYVYDPSINQNPNIASVQRATVPGSSGCAPDSDGYCALLASSTVTGSCTLGTVNGKPITGHNESNVYEVFEGSGGSVIYLTSATRNTKVCGGVSTTWSPANPAVTYNDPNLP